jgi:membrane protein required for colicin V production
VEWLPSAWVDLAMLAVLVLSAVVGLSRGITFELLSLAGWFAAYFAGRWLQPFVEPHLPIGEAGSALNRGAAFACAFLLVLIAWSLGARAVSALIAATPLRPLDRLLGAVFGLARGLVVLLVAATVIAFTPAARSGAWQASVGAAWLGAALHGLLPVLPAEPEDPGRRVRSA